MTADDRHRCRWHRDGGRCPHVQAFPGVPEVPELCVSHLHALDPWITRRAGLRAAGADAWIRWARDRAEDTEHVRRMLGERPQEPQGHRERSPNARVPPYVQ
jgi:hypothetical protein